MSKHHHQSKEEQLTNKEHGAAPFHFEKKPYPRSEAVQSEDIKTKATMDGRSTQLWTYQIHAEKGGLS